MQSLLQNPYRGAGLALDVPPVRSDAAAAIALARLCPRYGETPLLDRADIARSAGVSAVYLKDERGRMGLGSFKALGAAYVIARDAVRGIEAGMPTDAALAGRTYVAASAGNHGMSVVAGARVFGARAVIYIAETVPASFAERLAGKGATVVREGAVYEDSMAAAEAAARAEGWTLLSDSTWDGRMEGGLGVMEGYLVMAAEMVEQMPAPPTHVLLQAGVGGLAAAVAAHVRSTWGDAPRIVVVEPQAAPALQASIRAGRPVTAEGPVSAMGRLDCKTPSVAALNALSSDADLFVTVSEAEAADAVAYLRTCGIDTTPSGAAGLSVLLAGGIQPGPGARVLAILSEGPEVG